MANLFSSNCWHIITVNPSQLFSSRTFVAKGKLNLIVWMLHRVLLCEQVTGSGDVGIRFPSSIGWEARGCEGVVVSSVGPSM